ncbi:hypothetical protein WJX73_006694 [Symbiochloris irregularis]|uniref:Caprin-1 dimerization domain-containing protein n=1 Tax=Symbiochloris irregularis TaxID=706552 RepID=A0AAW1PMY1_9CHLO
MGEQGEKIRSEQVEKSAAETGDGGPVLKVISKRLRKFNKTIKHLETIEEAKAAGKALNEQQEEVLAGKAKAVYVIEELSRLVPLLQEAAAEETKAAVAVALAKQSSQHGAEVKQLEDAAAAAAVAAAEGGAEAGRDQHTVAQTVPPAAELRNRDSHGELSLAINDAVERLVQLTYFAQVFNPESGFPASHERDVCIQYDKELYGQDSQQLTGSDLIALANFGLQLTQRGQSDGQVCSHQDCLTRSKRLALAWVHRAEEPVPGTRFTVAQLANKCVRLMSSRFVATPPTVTNDDAESVQPLEENTKRSSPAPSTHGVPAYAGNNYAQMHQYGEQAPLLDHLHEPNGGMHMPMVDLNGGAAGASHGINNWAQAPDHIPINQLPQHLEAPSSVPPTLPQAEQGRQWIDPALVTASSDGGEMPSSSGPVDFNFMVESQVEEPVPNGQSHMAAAAEAGAEASAANGGEEGRGGRGRREYRGTGRYRGRGGPRGDRGRGRSEFKADGEKASFGDKFGERPEGDRGPRGGGRGDRGGRGRGRGPRGTGRGPQNRGQSGPAAPLES